MQAIEEQFRRMVFNIIARNQDDHTKNIAFLMDKAGNWKLSPAFDVTYSHNPAGKWTNQHQMSINGKRDHFNLNDLIALGDSISISKPKEIIDEVLGAIDKWPEFAGVAGVHESTTKNIYSYFRKNLM